jgi:hypothetical protein
VTYAHHPEKAFARRQFESVAWNISIHERFELETVSRASRPTLSNFDEGSWDQLHFRTQVATILSENGLETKADRYMSCSRQVFIYRCEGPEKHEFFAPSYCDLRFCQICGKRQFCRLRAKHSPVLEFIKRNPRPGFRLRRITLTSVNLRCLSPAQIRTFNHRVKKLLRILMKGITGWGAIAVLEVGFNNWNLHAHLLAWCPYIEQEKLAKVWHRVSGGRHVYISEESGSGEQALGYLLKYTSKPPSDIPENIGLLEVAFHRTRRVHCYGLFYNFIGGDPDGENSRWTGCPECGADLERVLGHWDSFDLPRKDLKFIGDCRKKGGPKIWVN